VADHFLDTGILIRHLRNRPGYRELMGRLARRTDPGADRKQIASRA